MKIITKVLANRLQNLLHEFLERDTQGHIRISFFSFTADFVRGDFGRLALLIEVLKAYRDDWFWKGTLRESSIPHLHCFSF
ncbi:unnamed protein product [Rhodiola kirilowii]